MEFGARFWKGYRHIIHCLQRYAKNSCEVYLRSHECGVVMTTGVYKPVVCQIKGGSKFMH